MVPCLAYIRLQRGEHQHSDASPTRRRNDTVTFMAPIVFSCKVLHGFEVFEPQMVLVVAQALLVQCNEGFEPREVLFVAPL